MKRKIWIIYTGGTIGMDVVPKMRKKEYELPQLNAAELKRRFNKYTPELSQIAHCQIDIVFNRDSSQIGPLEWCQLAALIKKRQTEFDGIVILHGTDTLSYTASALSLLLYPFKRPVILTGAQVPLSAIRSDAKQNLVTAVEIAASAPRPYANRVLVYFGDRLFLGSTVRKISATHFDAFDSPRFPHLATVGSRIDYTDTFFSLPKKKRTSPIKVLPRFSNRVSILPVTPAFPASAYNRFYLQSLDALILSLFPSGTAPVVDSGIPELVKRARSFDLPVVAIAERSGLPAQLESYPSGRELKRLGVFWGGPITPEYAFVKTALIAGQPQAKKKFKHYWKISLARRGKLEYSE